MATISQRSFTGGEISPYLYSRTDFVKYQTSAKKIKNFIPLKYGGIQNRPGFEFYGKAGSLDGNVRLIPFDLGGGISLALEFGHEYMRVHDSSGPVKYGSQTITNITWGPARVTHSGVLQGVSEEIEISGLSGAIGELLNGRNFKVSVISPTQFDLLNLDGSTFVPTSTPAYSSGGVFKEIYEFSTGIGDPEILDLQYSQNLNYIVLGTSALKRNSNTDWEYADIDLPSGATAHSHAVVGTAGTTQYAYIVTCEYAGLESDCYPRTIYTSGDPSRGNLLLRNLSYYSILNGNATLGLVNYNTLNARIYSDDLNSIGQNLLDVVFNFYKLDSGLDIDDPKNYGYIGSSIATWDSVNNRYEGSFDDKGFSPDMSINPPYYDIRFYPGTTSTMTPVKTTDRLYGAGAVSFAQGRLFFARDSEFQENIWASKINGFNVFYPKTPTTDDDPLAFRIAGAKFNPVNHIVPLSKLVILTDSTEFVINPDGSSLTPSNITAVPQSYNGSSRRNKPIIINDTCLYVQRQGTAVRDLSFEFNIDGFTGNDISIFASHLLEGYSIVDWSYQKVPNSVVWVVRDDGVLLSCTYLKEQQVLAWAQHETDGFVKSVCCIPGSLEDELFLVVERDNENQIEKMSTRFLNTTKQKVVTEFGVEKSKFVDDSYTVPFVDNYLKYDGRNGVFNFTMTISSYLGGGFTTEDTVTATASSAYFSSDMVGNELFIYGSDNSLYRLQIATYVSSTVIRATPIKNIPVELQGGSGTSHWAMAVDEVTGLWHLEGQDVAVQGDGFVDANPLNDSYEIVTVVNGKITLPQKRSYVIVGLPYVSDLRTLEVDTANGETTIDKKSLVNEVNVYVEKTRALWCGSEEPEDGDYKGNLTEMKFRSDENYESPTRLKTGSNSVVIQSVYGRGEVFIRQIDPCPANILSVNPSGSYPIR